MPDPERSQTSLTRFAPLMQDTHDEHARLAAKQAYRASEGQLVLINKRWLRNWADIKQLDLLAVAALGVKGEGR